MEMANTGKALEGGTYGMNVVSINCGPRKKMNTALLLDEAAKKATEMKCNVKSYDLYSLNYKGCYGCFECKREHGKSYGKCVVKDDLQNVFESIRECDLLIMGTPIYFWDVTGEMRSFLERLLFQHIVYSNPPRSLFDGQIKVGLVYTMNVLEDQYNQTALKSHLEAMESRIQAILGETKAFFAFGTNQLNNYDDIEYMYIDGKGRLSQHDEVFPKELARIRGFVENLIEK